MADNNTIQKVYDLKTLGGQETYQTLESINQMFIKIKENKQSFNGNFNFKIDTSGFNKLDQSINSLIAEMKTLGQIGSKMAADIAAAMSKMNMAAIPNIIKFQEFQATLKPGNITGYVNTITSLGGKLAWLKEQAEQLTGVQKRLKEELDKNIISEEEYNGAIATTTTELQMLKTQITEVNGAMTTANKLYNPALLKEETEELAANRVELAQRNQLIKAQAMANNALAGSIRGARAEITLLNREQENLVVERTKDIEITDEQLAANIARRDAIIAEKNALHEFIKANADSNLARVLNIGNYPTLTAEFADLKKQMGQLIVAGEQEGEEFQRLQARALELSAAMKEVNASTKETTSGMKRFGGKFASIVERMGIRMLANILIFQAAIEIGQALWEAWTKDAKEAEEANKAFADSTVDIATEVQKTYDQEIGKTNDLLYSIQDVTTSYNMREATIESLLGLYPELLRNLSDESLLTGDIAAQQAAIDRIAAKRAQVDRTNKEIEAFTTQRDDLKKQIAEDQANKGYFYALGDDDENEKKKKQIEDLESRIDDLKRIAKDVNEEIGFILNPKHSGRILVDIDADIKSAQRLRDQTEVGDQRHIDALKKIKDLEEERRKYLGDEKKAKEPHDYTAAILEAQKKLTDFLAKEAETRLQIEMIGEKEIADNTNRSLQQRLEAYAKYAANEKRILAMQHDAQVKDVQDKLDLIPAIEKKAKGKRTVEEETLLINKDALNAQLNYLNTEYKDKLAQADSNITKTIAGITSSSISKMLKDITDDASTRIAELQANATKAKRGLTGGAFAKQQEGIAIDDDLNVDRDKANIAANAAEQQALSEQIRQAQIAKRVDDEARMIAELQNLKNQAAGLDEKLRQDQDKQKQDNLAEDKKIQHELVDQSINAFDQIGNAYIQMLQQQMAYKERQAQMDIEWNKKVLDSQAQSNQQRMANDKAFEMEQKQREREKALENKKIAEAQMGIDYAVGVMKIWSVDAVDPVMAAIQTGVLTAVYGTKLAMMQAQQFGSGGEVPSNGGMFGGRPHASGGTPFLFQGGRFEAEAGEIAIINKNSAASNRIMTVTGTPKQIASGINAIGGGSNFAPGAYMHRFEWGGTMGTQLQPPAFIADYYTRQADSSASGSIMEMAKALQMHIDSTSNQFHNLKVSLDHRDVTAAQSSHSKSVNIGTL